MPRQPPASQRLPSEAPREEREEDARAAELERQLCELRQQLQTAQTARTHAEKRAREAEGKLTEKDQKDRSKGAMSKGTLDRDAKAKAERWVEKYEPADIAKLAMAIVTKAGKKLKTDLTPGIKKAKIFRKLRKQCYAERDSIIYKHLKENMYPAKRSALLRLIVGFSKREAHLISQSFKYVRNKDGSKSRAKLAPDSAMPLPVPFELADIKVAEAEAEKASKLVLSEHSDKRAPRLCCLMRRAAV